MKSRLLLSVLVVCTASLASPAQAEITAISPHGFTSTHTLDLDLAPEAAWALLTGGLPRWWDAEHSYGGQADQLSLEARRGGCLCETLEGGGWVEHLRVIHVAPHRALRLQGALGPLVDMGLQGIMRWTLEPREGGSTFTSRYVVSGHREGGFEQLAPVVDQVNGGHFERLKRVAAGLAPDDG